MKATAFAKLAQHPDLFDATAMRAARTLHDFDDLLTAPVHGYRDADDYWTRASSKPGLANIALPTLVLNARNDPFLPAHALPRPDQVSDSVTLDFPAEGGHVGFLSAPFPGNAGWMPQRVFHFFEHGH
jgi:predicted alpha/beta-fold hydrolase